MCEHVIIDIVLNSSYCARAVEQSILCCSRLRMTDFSHLFLLLKIMYRYNLVMEKESKTLNTYLLYVKVFITSVFHSLPILVRPKLRD